MYGLGSDGRRGIQGEKHLDARYGELQSVLPMIKLRAVALNNTICSEPTLDHSVEQAGAPKSDNKQRKHICWVCTCVQSLQLVVAPSPGRQVPVGVIITPVCILGPLKYCAVM